MFNKIKPTLISLLLLTFIFGGFLVFSLPTEAQEIRPQHKIEDPLGLITGSTSKDADLFGPIIKKVINTALGVMGSITLLVFVFGGVMWLTSAGKQEQVAKGSKTMLYAVIGLFVIFSAYAVLKLVIEGLTGGNI